MNLLYCQRGMLCPHFFGIGLLLLLCHGSPVKAQENFTLRGRVVSEKDGEPLPGASVRLRETQKGTITDKLGNFAFNVTGSSAALNVSFIGFVAKDTLLALPLDGNLVIRLRQDASHLSEVVVTGYQHIAAERATGSFVSVNNKLVNRRVSANILERLDGIASGMLFVGLPSNTVSANPLGRNLNIRIRGESTLAEANQVSRDPLIVLDNFPFDGNLDQINPNDIENITILKDAGAASIWGARAGNGVIVITTKKGQKNRPLQVDLNSNITIAAKPDLSYPRKYLPGEAYAEVEKLLFDAGYFNSDLNNVTTRPPVSPVVELLAQKRAGTLSASEADAAILRLAAHDLRADYQKYVYRKAVSQQYSLGMSGGTQNAVYRFSAGYDHNLPSLQNNRYQRVTLNTSGTYSLTSRLELSVGLNWSLSRETNPNSLNFGTLSVGGKYTQVYPYARLADDNGNPAAIVKDYRGGYTDEAVQRGLLDWKYRPLEELNFADASRNSQMWLVRTSLKYRLFKELGISFDYQNDSHHRDVRDHYSQDTYNARSLINRFSMIDNTTGQVTYQIPRGGILDRTQVNWKSANVRGQLNYNRNTASWMISSIAGAELRELRTDSYTSRLYGYRDDIGIASNNLDFLSFLPALPVGSARIPNPGSNGISGYVNRFISYYANGALTFRNRYTFTLSGRKDGANIFGAKTNNRLTPLWSAGVLWDVAREPAFNLNWLPVLRVRTTYGYNGNVYQGAVYTTGAFITNSVNGAPAIAALTAPNSELQWEKVRNLNFGLDFGLRRDVVSGSIELYRKSGLDLIQNDPLAPSKGFLFYYANSASTKTTGLDLTLSTRNLSGKVRWNTTFLLNTVKDRITSYAQQQTASSIRSLTGRPGIVGKPLYSVYSYRWAGLDPSNGDPQGYLNGAVSKNYLGIMNNFNPDSLVFHGSARPVVFGSVRNDFSWKGISVSANLVYKLGYHFRRTSTSLNYSDILSQGGHIDYLDRWNSEGDEKRTSIPSLTYPSNANRAGFYEFSEVLVTRGDHIRLQDVRIDYTIPLKPAGVDRIRSMAVYFYANNLGILWRANRYGIDPDFADTPTVMVLPAPFSCSLGIRLQL